MRDNISSLSSPFVWVHDDDVIIKGKKGVKMVCILEPTLPDDLKDTIEFLIETGLSEVERMREVLQIMEWILRRDERFKDIAAEMKVCREIVFREGRHIPFTMIEARAILSKFRKWQNAIVRVLEA